jgi:isoquinoline 1-oxidoreductase alpha subunit
MKLNINGKDRNVDAPDDMPLLWVLRDVLQMTGTKYGCGESLCGACTVHVDGKATRSCTLWPRRRWARRSPPSSRSPRTPTTRCCAPGPSSTSSSAATASRARSCRRRRSSPRRRSPPADEIDAAMKGNLCRCGTYERIRAAVARAAELKGGAR